MVVLVLGFGASWLIKEPLTNRQGQSLISSGVIGSESKESDSFFNERADMSGSDFGTIAETEADRTSNFISNFV